MYTSNLKWIKREKRVTKPEKSGMKHGFKSDELQDKPVRNKLKIGRSHLNDIGFRLILIPFFGIAIPFVSGMMDSLEFTTWTFKLSILFTIGIAWMVWEGNRFLLFTLRNYFDWFDKPLRKIAALLLVVPFYTIPISVLFLVLWHIIFNDGVTDWTHVWLATMIILVCVIFIVHVYETVFLVKEAESEKLQNARLERAKAEAELQSLKNQIDPHFLFNSLNTLSYFIESDPTKAKLFNQKLSDVYRYILQNRDRNFILLSEELQFVEDYFAMLRLRFESTLVLENRIPPAVSGSFLTLPISIQMQVENAVKHNEFSMNEPLIISISIVDNAVQVTNRIIKKHLNHTSGLGLKNLDERCRLLMGRALYISDTKDEFIVKIPISKV